MGMWDWVGRLIGKGGVAAQAAPRQDLDEDWPDHEVTAAFLWGRPASDLYVARLLSIDGDLVALNRLAWRVLDLWRSGRPVTRDEAEVLRLVKSRHRAVRRMPLPPGYCRGRRAYLYDLEWPVGTVEEDVWEYDPNRSLVTLRPSGQRLVAQPRRPGDLTAWARHRLRGLRSRRAVPVTALRVQANYQLYEAGNTDAPGVVVFSPSPDADPKALEVLAEQIYAARDRVIATPPGLDDAVRLARDNVQGWSYHRRARIPPEAYAADLWFHRPFLRDGRIVREQGRALRCLAELGPEGGIELLPWDTEPGPPVVCDPAWLTRNDGAVVKVARAIAAERRFADLPILADALEEAGCADEQVLGHCRHAGEHLHGCWVLDLLERD